ncbi:MAG: lipopolysaccharide transport periplasmic protein LptA [gamma proteobacterium symbiont of Taylorina sp.]|nr:lipopolysaccharide transport periplasmic protein LptA [gamma proteobacterium symbiont of Taylorina sp.]
MFDKRTVIIFFIFIFIFISTPGYLLALESDRNQPISLEADFADIDDLKGMSVYTGNVILIQGSMVIKADELTLYHNADRDLEKAIARGEKKLATFKQRPEGKEQDFKARASTIEYFIKKEKIYLLNNAHVTQDGGSFSANKITYDTKKETVVASSKKDKQGKPVSNGRVKVTIPARQKK